MSEYVTAEMAPEPSRVHEHVFANSLGESRASRTALCDREFNRAEPAARSQNLLLARKTWPMLAGVRGPVRGPVKGKRNQS